MSGSRVDIRKEAELLKSLGLSDGEATLYLSLIGKPEGESLERLVGGSELPAGVAEESLRSLADRGLVKIASNRVEAAQPKAMLEKVLEEKRRLIEDQVERDSSVASELERLLEPVYWETRLGVRPEDILEPLTDLREMELRTVRILSDASKEAFIFAETFGWYGKVHEALFQAHDRGVVTRILMMVKDESTEQKAKELRGLGVQVRHSTEEWYPVRGTLVDDQELVFLIWATKKIDGSRPVYYRPHYTKNQGLIRIFRDAFMKRWDAAQPI